MEVAGASTKATRKGEIVAYVASLYEGDGLAALWERLKPLQKKAVAEVVYSESDIFDLGRFVAKYGDRPEKDEPDKKERALFGYYEPRFTMLNFFFFGGHLPTDLKERLKELAPEPEPLTLKTSETPLEDASYDVNIYDTRTRTSELTRVEVPVKVLETETIARMDLLSVLRLIDAGKLAVSDKTHQPGNAAQEAIAALLVGGDYYEESDGESLYMKIGAIKPFAWVMLVQAGGLAEFNGKRLALTAAGMKALTAPPENTLRSLWKKWLSTTLLDEMRRVDAVKGQTGKAKSGLTAPSGRRAMIARALADCPVGRWVEVDDFRRYMRASEYLFEVSRDPWGLYIADANYGSLGYGSGSDLLDSRYLFCLLFEYAATLGLLDVAYVPPQHTEKDYGDLWGTDDLEFLSRYDGLLQFRLNALGEYCLGKSSKYMPPRMAEQAVLSITPEGEIEPIGSGLTPSDRFLLGIYAEQVSEDLWRLEPPKLLSALEEGHRFDQLKEFLSARGGRELPERVDLFLREVETRAARLVRSWRGAPDRLRRSRGRRGNRGRSAHAPSLPPRRRPRSRRSRRSGNGVPARFAPIGVRVSRNQGSVGGDKFSLFV